MIRKIEERDITPPFILKHIHTMYSLYAKTYVMELHVEYIELIKTDTVLINLNFI